MSYISKIDPETAGEKEKEVIRTILHKDTGSLMKSLLFSIMQKPLKPLKTAPTPSTGNCRD
ncbi:MAG: hypothetical protein ACLS61_01005 [Ruminococcus sp.]